MAERNEVQRRRALVVEDDGAMRELLVELLELRGFDVDAVASGEEAIAALQAGLQPAVLVLDRRMPGMSGDDVLRRLKSDPAWARIPVAMVTGMPRREQALGTEPDAYLEKPFDVDVLEEALSDIGVG
jgi:CheY-like chemotaxis protein